MKVKTELVSIVKETIKNQKIFYSNIEILDCGHVININQFGSISFIVLNCSGFYSHNPLLLRSDG